MPHQSGTSPRAIFGPDPRTAHVPRTDLDPRAHRAVRRRHGVAHQHGGARLRRGLARWDLRPGSRRERNHRRDERDLILTLVGVTYLFAIARNNGTVDLIVRGAVRAVGGRVALIPWVMFGVTGILTSIGAASPAACAIVGPIALGFAGRYRISPLMMGMLVVHGAQAGGFSPISIYGVITNSVMAENDLPVDEGAIFFTSLLINFAIAVGLFFALGGRQLASRRIGPADSDAMP